MTLNTVKTGEGSKVCEKTTAVKLRTGDRILLFDGLGGRAQLGRISVSYGIWCAYEDHSSYTQVMKLTPNHPVLKVVGKS